MVQIIGLAGCAGVGKDYIIQNKLVPILERDNKRWIQLAFADQIKVNAMTRHNLSYNDLYVEKTTESRRYLQDEGTERGRNVYGADIWVKTLEAWCNIFEARGTEIVLISDVRFIEEINWIRERGGTLVYINAPMRNKERLMKEANNNPATYRDLYNHSSERILDTLTEDQYDYVINNDPGEPPILDETFRLIAGVAL